MDSKLERPDPNDEPVAEEKEMEDSNAKYTKMEFPCKGTKTEQCIANCRIRSSTQMQHKNLK